MAKKATPKSGKKSKKTYSLYQKSDRSRVYEGVEEINSEEEYRTCWRRDFARLVHSPSFRRLQGKTQLYPGVETDYFRNRLTHSIEVAQIAKSIAIKINNLYSFPDKTPIDIDVDLVEFAGLAHDLGHPPFGHQGEYILDRLMIDEGGFEGNAQTLRILSKLEKKVAKCSGFDNKGKDKRVGLNLTYRALAAVLKYDKSIPASKKSREYKKQDKKPVKGYYLLEEELADEIKSKIIVDKGNVESFKTIECQIMDIADDIAYSTYDLDDGLKAGFFNPFDILYADAKLYDKVCDSINERLKNSTIPEERKITVTPAIVRYYAGQIFSEHLLYPDKNPEESDHSFAIASSSKGYVSMGELANNGFLRHSFTSKLIGDFIQGVQFELDEFNPCLSKVWLEPHTRVKVEVLKTFTYEMQITSPKLRIVEYRGQEIVNKIFETISSDGGFQLMPSDFIEIYLDAPEDQKRRVICDFIAGMTDRYAIEFYGRLTSENPETIFKPL